MIIIVDVYLTMEGSWYLHLLVIAEMRCESLGNDQRKDAAYDWVTFLKQENIKNM